MTDPATTPVASLAVDESRSMAHGEQLSRTARKHPDRVAFICGGEERTFAEVDRRVDRLARWLATRGVAKGDRLALVMGNSIEMAEALFAGWRLGALVVPVNFRLVADEVRFVLQDSGATAVICDERLAELTAAACIGLHEVATVVVLVSPVVPPTESAAVPTVRVPTGPAPAADGPVVVDAVERAAGFERLDLSMASGDDEPCRVAVSEGDPALLMYTSGTTGRPKGAVLSHMNVVMSTMSAMIVQGIGGYDDVWYGNLPLFHIGGLSGILPYVLGGGHTVIVPSTNFDPAAAVADLGRYGVTGCCFIGMQWDHICDEIVAQQPVLRLRRATWGAADIPRQVLEKMGRTLGDIPILSFFGQTEMSPVTCVLTAEDFERKRGSVGRPMINVEARLVDDDGQPVGPGEIGEIVYRGPTVMQGYWNMPEATAEAFAGGWFHSGDLCRADEEGYLWVVDRKKDMIISGGENIYCPEVEEVLRGHPGVADVALIGVADPTWGETPRAVVVPADPDRPPAEDELIAWCKERLASYKKPTSVVMVDALPRNAGGKVLKPALRARWASPVAG